MSLIISLLEGESEFVKNEIVYTNQELSRYNLPNYQYPSSSSFDKVTLPYLCWQTQNFVDLKYLAARLKKRLTLSLDEIFDISENKLELLKEYELKNQSHLICHSMYYGSYVPIDFQGVTLPREFLKNIGSSISLLEELREMASQLELDLGEYMPDFALLYKERIEELECDFLSYEKFLVLYFYNMALGSIKHQLIIYFSG